ncbi:putative uncharacterized protein DDB_G0281733 [Apis dorsata]|uniref:putative uncharacterized protein DDB_G0281733 n=1 Tax=Apis dorsata TaxID=7462 RepID=UPI001293E02D|nr:putative uncharacterized protein DDB_G0281733 [Apis dorsata]
MSRQLRGERDHVSRCDLREQRDFRDLRDLRDRDPRDFRDYPRDRDIRDDRDDVERVRDDYLDYDHHPTAASTSALTNNPERSNGRATLHEGRDDLQLVNLCVPPRSTIVLQFVVGVNVRAIRPHLHRCNDG